MQVIRCFAIVAVAALLHGCGSSYVKPADTGSVAYLSFDAKGDPAMGFAAYLELRPSGAASYQRAARIVEGNPILHTDNPDNIPVAANQDLMVKAMYIPAGVLGQYGCDNEKPLRPEVGKHYKVIVEWKRQVNCTTTIEEVASAQVHG